MEFHLAQIAYQSCVQFDFVYLAVKNDLDIRSYYL